MPPKTDSSGATKQIDALKQMEDKKIGVPKENEDALKQMEDKKIGIPKENENAEDLKPQTPEGLPCMVVEEQETAKEKICTNDLLPDLVESGTRESFQLHRPRLTPEEEAQQAWLLAQRPTWNFTRKVEDNHCPRSRKLFDSRLINGLFRSLNEAEKRQWKAESDRSDLRLVPLLLKCMNEKVYFLKNPRFQKTLPPLQVLLVSQRQETIGGITELIPLESPLVGFDNFEIGKEYMADIQILNRSAWSQRISMLQD